MGDTKIDCRGKVQSLERGLSILEILPANPEEGLRLGEIAKRLELSKSTAHRLLSSLVHRGFVIQDEAKGRYRIGYKTLEISRKILNNLSVTDLIIPYLRRLAEMTGETAGFALVDKEQSQITLSNEIMSKNPVKPRSHLGETIALMGTACGKVYLSMLSHDKFEQLIEKIGKKIVFSRDHEHYDDFREELKRIKRQGYACSSQPDSENLMCVAAPIMDEGGELQGILSIYGPAYRMDNEVLKKFGQIVRDVANEISLKMGFVAVT